MPDPFHDLSATMAKLDESLATIKAWQDSQLDQLKSDVARSELSLLSLQITLLKADIEVSAANARILGKEVPDDLQRKQQLAAKIADLEALQVKYGLRSSKPRRWWQFWK
jgi:hypothetical protein